jgi:hypothetical protein
LRGIQKVAIVAVVAVFGAALVLANLPSSSPEDVGNLLSNGGFETGGTQGWQSSGTVPVVQSDVAYNGGFAARFQTPANGGTLTQCTVQAQQCGLLNSSSISQDVSSITLASNTTLSLAVYPSFQPPSIFQVTLSFVLPSQPSTEATVYYIAAASSAQCDAYGRLLTNATLNSQAYCIAVKQGTWNPIARNLPDDLPASPGLSKLAGSTLTLSLSFAGGNSTDLVYADSIRIS